MKDASTHETDSQPALDQLPQTQNTPRPSVMYISQYNLLCRNTNLFHLNSTVKPSAGKPAAVLSITPVQAQNWTTMCQGDPIEETSRSHAEIPSFQRCLKNKRDDRQRYRTNLLILPLSRPVIARNGSLRNGANTEDLTGAA